MNTLFFTLATPDGTLFEGDVLGVFLRAAEGDLAVLPHHAPLITTVQKGAVRIKTTDGGERSGLCEGGILHVDREKTSLLSSSFHFTKE